MSQETHALFFFFLPLFFSYPKAFTDKSTLKRGVCHTKRAGLAFDSGFFRAGNAEREVRAGVVYVRSASSRHAPSMHIARHPATLPRAGVQRVMAYVPRADLERPATPPRR